MRSERLYLGAFAQISKEYLRKEETHIVNDYACCGKRYPFFDMMTELEGTYCKFCGKKIEKCDIEEKRTIFFGDNINGKYEGLTTISYSPDFIYIVSSQYRWIDLERNDLERPRLIGYDSIEQGISQLWELIKSSGIIEDIEEFTGRSDQLTEDCMEFGLLIE